MVNSLFTFAWEGAPDAWRHLQVVELRGTEAMSALYRYEMTLLGLDSTIEPDPDDLIGARGTLRIVTDTEPRSRPIHGVIVEAEELGRTPAGMSYRMVLAPPLVRAMHRTRCRIFLEKTLRQIIDAVLGGDSELARADGTVVEPDEGLELDYQPIRELYAWRVSDTSRIDQVAARPYCVQYNESDLAFVSRLLEEEGISYHVENGSGVSLLVLSDADAGRSRLEPPLPLGPNIKWRTVPLMKLGARMRPSKVTLQDYNWKNPALSMAVVQQGGAGSGGLVDHAYPGRYPDTPAQGDPLAVARLGRLAVEASYAAGETTCRVLSAGAIFTLEHPQARYDGEYLVTRMDVRGTQPGWHPGHGTWRAATAERAQDTSTIDPFTCSFECARRGKGGQVAESRFRPARVTPKPRIVGSQTAFVTDEPSSQGQEIHIGGPPGAEIGCVRVRFHWDQDEARLASEPSSCWVRVSQVFAGLGQGAVWHPRVGVEVVVDHEDGDPDRPLIVGRVYNGQNRPPTVVPTVSTLKSMTSPGDGTFNEFTFDDTAGAQQIKLHTPKDWNCEVGNDRTETVGNDSTSSVGNDRAESTGQDRSTMVGNNNSEIVANNEQITVGTNQTVGIGVDQTTSIGADQAIVIGANQTVGIGANQTIGVGADQNVEVDGNQTVVVKLDQSVEIQGQQQIDVAGDRAVSVQKNLHEDVAMARTISVQQNDHLFVQGEQLVSITKIQRTQYGADHKLSVQGAHTVDVEGKQDISSKGDQSLSTQGNQSLTAQDTTSLFGQNKATVGSQTEVDVSAATVVISGKKLRILFDDIEISGKTINISGSKITMDGGKEVTVQAAIIKLN